jgi:hypothetical protein
MGILHGFIFQALLLMNDISVMLYGLNSRWRPAVSSPAFTTGYAGDCYSYGHTIGIDSTVR